MNTQVHMQETSSKEPSESELFAGKCDSSGGGATFTNRSLLRVLKGMARSCLGPFYGNVKSGALKLICRAGMFHLAFPGMSPLKVHLGCGTKYLDGFVNIDLFSRSADILADSCHLPFLKSNSVAHVLSEHMLEHLSRWEGQEALKEWARVLLPGGKLEIEVPDILWCLEEFAQASEAARYRGEYENQGIIATIYGMQTNDGQFHKFGYTPDQLVQCVEASGLCVTDVKCYMTPHPCRSIRVIACKPS